MSARPSPDAIIQLGLGFWASKTLLSACELGLFSELGAGSLGLPELSERLQLHPRSARDFVDALVALKMLTRDGDRYANTPATSMFLDRAKPTYIGGILEMANARLYSFWGSLTEALRTGELQNEAKAGGQSFFEALYEDPVRLKGFMKAMTGLSLGTVAAIAEKFPWAEYRTFADVGTAQGGLPVLVALAHPHLTGIGFDLPVIGPIFGEYVRSHDLSNRLRFQAGDFFQDALPSADVIVMGHILHDWDLDQKRHLIAKVFDALPKRGAFIAFEAIIDDQRRENAFGLLMSLNMLIETQGGFDYTGADCAGWMRNAGFRETRVEHLVGPDSMVIGIK
jgi:hypothetical protein